MKKLIFFFLLATGVQFLQAQRFLNPTWIDAGPRQGFISAYGFGSLSSAQISNQFLLELSSKGAIETEVKNKQLGRLRNANNLIGGDYSVGFQGGYTLPGRCLAVVLSFSDEAHVNAHFSGDLAKLAFAGNKQFAGEEALFNQTSMSALRFQKMGAGLNFTPNDEASYGFMVSFLNGETTGSLSINRGSLYTSTLGDTLLLAMAGSAYYSDTSNTGFMKHNGGGAALDLFFTQQFQALNSDWEVTALLMNIGVIQWHPETERYAVDTNVQFTGIGINDIDGAQTAINNFNLEDSLLGGIRSGFSRGTINQVIPGYMQLQVSRVIDNGFDAGFGIVVRWQVDSRTYSWINLGYKFNKNFGLQSEWGYGGYGGFQSGLSAMYRSDAFAASLRLGNIEALVAPASFGGITLGCGVQYFFGL